MGKDIRKQATEVREEETNDDSLLEKVGNGLGSLGAIESDDEDSTPDKQTAEETEEQEGLEEEADEEADETEDEEVDDADEEAPEDDSTPDEDQADETSEEEPSDKDADEKGLPDSYVRAAIHQGWDEKEIKDFYKSDPKRALKTFGNIYNSTNNLSSQFAQLGQARKKMEQEGDKTQPSDSKEKPEKSDEDFDAKLKKLREEYDNDPIVDLIEEQHKSNAELRKELQDMKQQQPEQPQKDDSQETEAIVQQINGFFTDDSMNLYNDFYGTIDKGSDWDNSLTPAQKANRMEVVQLADDIMAGAEQLGQDLSVEEALLKAHLSVSDPIKTQMIRNDIKKKVVKRSKGLTHKPNSGGKPEDGKPRNDKELAEKVGQRMSKFGL